jgi:MFS family permease
MHTNAEEHDATVNLDQPPPIAAWKPWVFWGVPAVFYLLVQMARNAPSSQEHALEQLTGGNAASIAMGMSLYFFTYAPLQLICGRLLDTFGSRGLLAISAIISAGGLVILAAADSTSLLAVSRLVVGAGSAIPFIACIFLASIWHPPSRVARVSGLTNTVGMAGSVMALSAFPFLFTTVGWSISIYWLAGATLLMAPILFLCVPKRPAWYMQRLEIRKDRRESLGEALRALARDKVVWMAGTAGGFLSLPVSVIGGLWGARYLQSSGDFTLASAGTIVALVFAGLGVGTLFFGWVCDRWKRKRLPLVIGGFGGAIATSLVILIPAMPLGLLGAMVFLSGVCGGSLTVTYLFPVDSHPPSRRGVAIAFVNFLVMGLAGLFQWLVGVLLSWQLGGSTETAAVFIGLRNALLLVPIFMAIAGVLGLLIPERPNAANVPHPLPHWVARWHGLRKRSA